VLRGPHAFTLSQAFATLGAGTFLAAFLNASRVHRDRADELYAALPVRAAARTGAILCSLAAAAGVAALVGAIAWLIALGPDGQIVIGLEALSPSLLEPAQVPLIVAAFGAAGVCFGRWTAQPVLAPLLTIAIWVGPLAWSIPWVAGPLAAASPTSLPRRRGARLAAGVPLAALAWLGVLALSDAGARTLEAAALVAAALGRFGGCRSVPLLVS
jgi:hypothetical protein